MSHKKIISKTSADFILPQMVDNCTRRCFIQSGISLSAYMTAAQFIGIGRADAATAPIQRRLIWINMYGGWDVLETADPKASSNSSVDVSFGWDLAQHLAGAEDSVRL